MTPYRTPVDYLAIIPDPPSLTSAGPRPFPVHAPPPPPRRHHTEEIEDILEDEIVSIADG